MLAWMRSSLAAAFIAVMVDFEANDVECVASPMVISLFCLPIVLKFLLGRLFPILLAHFSSSELCVALFLHRCDLALLTV